MTTNQDLKACPFCGETEKLKITAVSSERDDGRYYEGEMVQCLSPACDVTQASLRSWNGRPGEFSTDNLSKLSSTLSRVRQRLSRHLTNEENAHLLAASFAMLNVCRAQPGPLYTSPPPQSGDVADAHSVCAVLEEMLSEINSDIGADIQEGADPRIKGPAHAKADALYSAISIIQSFFKRAAKGGEGGTQAANDVLAERQRQVEKEGWTPEHDDEHDNSDLAAAAASYILQDFGVPVLIGGQIKGLGGVPLWPWSPNDWKPRQTRRNLVRAGALIIAEIERLDRKAALTTKHP